MGYATLDDLRTVDIPTQDVEVGDLTFRVAALTRAQLKWAMDEVGYEEVDGERSLRDAESADLIMLACSIVDPPLDESDPEHVELLRGLPHVTIKALSEAMMTLSGLRDEDPI